MQREEDQHCQPSQGRRVEEPVSILRGISQRQETRVCPKGGRRHTINSSTFASTKASAKSAQIAEQLDEPPLPLPSSMFTRLSPKISSSRVPLHPPPPLTSSGLPSLSSRLPTKQTLWRRSSLSHLSSRTPDSTRQPSIPCARAFGPVRAPLRRSHRRVSSTHPGGQRGSESDPVACHHLY